MIRFASFKASTHVVVLVLFRIKINVVYTSYYQ